VVFSIDTEVLGSGIVLKPKLWYQAIPTLMLYCQYTKIDQSDITLTNHSETSCSRLKASLHMCCIKTPLSFKGICSETACWKL